MHEIIVEDVKEYLRRSDKMFHFTFADLPYEMDIIGNEWDRSGIAFDVEMYRLLLSHHVPGSFAAFYGFSRTHHRVMVALEDAGWIIHKTMLAWIYPDGNAQGAQNTSKAIDKAFASLYGGFCKCAHPKTFTTHDGYINEYLKHMAYDVEFCRDCEKPVKQVVETIQHSKTGGMKNIGGPGYGNGNVQEITKPLTIDSAAMNQRVYGLGFGKPVLEPIIIVQAPYAMYKNESEIRNIIREGTGTVNKAGRHPSNFIYMHHPDCVAGGECSPDCLTAKLQYKYHDFYYALEQDLDAHVFSHIRAKKERHEGLTYDNPHPSVKPLAVDTWISEIFLPPDVYGPFTAFNPFMGSGSEMIGMRRAGWDNVVGLDINPVYAKVAFDRNQFYFPREEIQVSGKLLD